MVAWSRACTPSSAARAKQGWLEQLAALDFSGVYLKQRPRQANQIDEAERQARAPEHAISGADAPESFAVLEQGVPFEVRLGDGLSTGLFLDQRENRARFAALAPGKRVLNLFAYTCAFGVVAARAGAASHHQHGVSKAALERGKRNYALSGIAHKEHLFLARDVLESLPRMKKRGETFDLIALDPPSYASTRHGRFNVERDYEKLATLALSLLGPGGTLLACVNHARMRESDLQRALELAQRRVGLPTVRVSFAAPPADHPPEQGRPSHLKSAWISA